MLSGTDPEFPKNCWDLLVPQANISLNLLRSSRIQPKLSAYALIHGNFNYNATPMAPPGCKIVIHDRAGERKSWAEHASRGYCIGPALHHYRNYLCYLPTTNSTRVSNTVEFFPHNWTIPSYDLQDRLEESLGELIDVLTKKQTAHQLPQSPGLIRLQNYSHNTGAQLQGWGSRVLKKEPTNINELQHLKG